LTVERIKLSVDVAAQAPKSWVFETAISEAIESPSLTSGI